MSSLNKKLSPYEEQLAEIIKNENCSKAKAHKRAKARIATLAPIAEAIRDFAYELRKK